METLSSLICGDRDDYGEAAIVMGHIRSSLDAFGDKAISLVESSASSDLKMFGPFCGRVIMESACTAVLGRIDPFRILYLSRFQSRSGYDPTKRAKSSFAWQGDVLTADKETGDLWGENIETSKISRALFSHHKETIFWKPAATAAWDCIASAPSSPYLEELLQSDAEKLCAELKGRGNALYSQLSKGVHWEFFTDNIIIFDEATVKQAIRDAITWVCKLSVVSHFIPTSLGRLSGEQSIAKYVEVLERINA